MPKKEVIANAQYTTRVVFNPYDFNSDCIYYLWLKNTITPQGTGSNDTCFLFLNYYYHNIIIVFCHYIKDVFLHKLTNN